VQKAGSLLFAFAGAFVLALCSDLTNAAPPSLSLAAGRLYTAEGREVVFSKFEFVGDSARYEVKKEHSPTLVPTAFILRVDQVTGNESRKGAVVGCLGGFAEAWLIMGAFYGIGKLGDWLDAAGGYGSGGEETTFDWAAGRRWSLVGAVAGAGLGYWYGAGFKRYTRAYDDPSLWRP
jgi:hypothetical protein